MTINNSNKVVLALTTLFLVACGSQKMLDKVFVLENPGSVDQISAVLGIPVKDLGDLQTIDDLENVLVADRSTGTILLTQWIDNDQDSTMDELLVQIDLEAGAQKEIRVYWEQDGNKLKPAVTATTYSRFVPERIDDYAWENDKVAFRTFGPVAQKLAEENQPGGTLSSGIDLWLKKVDYSIIDKWYTENLNDKGYYHVDHGEGYDPYHVGISRGTGGIGVWEGDTLLRSKNFVAYRTIANGPLRTVFELDYAPWSPFEIQETKRISLDLGSNFSKFEIKLSAKEPVPNYTIGIMLHKGTGEVEMHSETGYYSYWEQIDEAFVGSGVVIDPRNVMDALDYRTTIRDQSQLLIMTDPNQKILTYYAGFAWSGSGQVSNQQDWLQMLEKQAVTVSNPILVTPK